MKSASWIQKEFPYEELVIKRSNMNNYEDQFKLLPHDGSMIRQRATGSDQSHDHDVPISDEEGTTSDEELLAVIKKRKQLKRQLKSITKELQEVQKKLKTYL